MFMLRALLLDTPKFIQFHFRRTNARMLIMALRREQMETLVINFSVRRSFFINGIYISSATFVRRQWNVDITSECKWTQTHLFVDGVFFYVARRVFFWNAIIIGLSCYVRFCLRATSSLLFLLV